MSIVLPPATRALILVNAAVYLLQRFVPQPMETLFALQPLASGLFRPWQLLTYAFLHDPSNLAHIVLNMFALFMFGRTLELYWGASRFVVFYLVSVIAAAVTQLAVEGVRPDMPNRSLAPRAAYSVYCWLSPGISRDSVCSSSRSRSRSRHG